MAEILHDNLKRVIVNSAQLSPTPSAVGDIVAYGDDRVPVMVVEMPGADQSRQLDTGEVAVQFPPFVASGVQGRGNGGAIAVGTDLTHLANAGAQSGRLLPGGAAISGSTPVPISDSVSATVLEGAVAQNANTDDLVVLFR